MYIDMGREVKFICEECCVEEMSQLALPKNKFSEDVYLVCQECGGKMYPLERGEISD